jgi:two-component system, LuxR family, response regulator FixJ
LANDDVRMEATIALLSNIYIVDDDLSFGKSLRRLLNARGFSADCFGSAQSFLDSVPPGQQGYAVVDIHMPECDGFCLIDKMNALHYKMRIVVITGRAPDDARELALRKGTLGLLQKPFSEESLLELLNSAEYA